MCARLLLFIALIETFLRPHANAQSAFYYGDAVTETVIADLKCPGLEVTWDFGQLTYKLEHSDIADEAQTLLRTIKKHCGITKQVLKAEAGIQKLISANNQRWRDYYIRQIPNIAKYRSPERELKKIESYNTSNAESAFKPEVAKQYIEEGLKLQMARQKNCSDVDLRQPPLDKVRDQDSKGFCFAYTAADLISAKTKKYISAIDLSFLTYKRGNLADTSDKNDIELKAGLVEDAFTTGVTQGLCLETDSPSSDFKFSDINYDLQSAYQEILSFKRKFDQNPKEFENCAHCFESESEWRKLFPHLGEKDLLSIMKKAQAKNIISELTFANCPKRFLPKNTLKISSPNYADQYRVLDEKLSAGEIVGIVYNPNFLHHTRFPTNEKDSTHASTIVGRHFDSNTGTCQYLIRNSWGSGCQQYDSLLKCEKGFIWAPEEELKKHLWGINTVEEK